MFNPNKLSSLLLTVGLVFTAGSQATSVTVEQFAGAMLAQTVAATQAELNNSIQVAVLSASNMFSLEEQDVYATYLTKVTITDLDTMTGKEVTKKAE